MADPTPAPLAAMARRLGAWRRLEAADRDAILALPFSMRSVEAGQAIVTEGQRPTQVCVLREGYAFRQKVVGGGARQILAIHIPGDLVDLHNALLDYADHSVQALTSAHVVLIPRDAVEALAAARPAVAMAMWHETLVDAAVLREWTTSIGRRAAQVRLAHLLCELMVRLRAAGQASDRSYDIPMSQEQLADCTGMTAIHLNRMLMSLERAGAIARRGRSVSIVDWDKLVELGDFDDGYLHLPGHARSSRRKVVAAE
jgi:CRP-like cAMP-binding protein